MKTTTLRYFAATCAFGLIPTAAQAQVGQQQTDQSAAKQVQTEQTGQPSGQPTQQIAPGQTLPGQTQPGQPQAGQNQPVRQQPIRAQAGQTLPGPTTPGQRVNTDSQSKVVRGANRASQQGEKAIENIITKKLMIENKAEVEIAQIGVDKASSDEVKKFAQTLVNDHRQLGEELKQFHGSHVSDRAGSADQRNLERRDGTKPVESQRNVSQAGSIKTSDVKSERTQPDGAIANREGVQGGNQSVAAQVANITEKACKNHLEMVRKELEGRDGKEFDMAFVGMQIASHTRAVAEMQALEGVGSKELQQVVQKAEKHMTSHLDQAKQLADRLKDSKSN